MNELAGVVSEFGLEALLQHIHTVIVILESDGTVVSSNAAFDSIRTLLPNSSKLEDHIPFEERKDFRYRLRLACESDNSSRWVLNLVTGEAGMQVAYDALLLPVPSQRALLFAERIAVDPEISRIIDRLHRQVKLFRIESEQAKKIALAKHAETEAVIAQAEEVSHMDELTLLPNRRGILADLQDEVYRARRYNTPLSVSMLDLDHFKKINDSYGHGTGDKVLRQVAMILRDNVREPDRVARYGGEEFLIVLPNSTLQAASEQAARLCRQVRESIIQVNANSISVTISIGVAEFRNGTDSWQMLLERADTAMYEAKNAGRDGWATSRR